MLKQAMDKILIVGAGLTGATAAALLRKELPAPCQLSIWDKARGSGGRMSTSRDPQGKTCTVDLGAQYVSARPNYIESHKSFYDELLSGGVLMPFEGIIEGERQHPTGTKHFVAPQGISHVVKHFLTKSGASLKFEQQVCEVSKSGHQWQVTTTGGATDTFDCVILTLPVPQILQLQGTVSTLIDSRPEDKEKLKNVQYSSRFALGLFFSEGTKVDVPWDAKYFYDDPCIRFVAIDNKKRGLVSELGGSSLAVHTSVPFSLEHLEEEKEAVAPTIMDHLKKLIPELPEPSGIKPHKWRYSQVHKGYEGNPGVLILHDKPPLILAGDAFTHSNFDGCVNSAQTVVQAVVKANSQL